MFAVGRHIAPERHHGLRSHHQRLTWLMLMSTYVLAAGCSTSSSFMIIAPPLRIVDFCPSITRLVHLKWTQRRADQIDDGLARVDVDDELGLALR
jgi:uncharacterized lipoprotein YajG